MSTGKSAAKRSERLANESAMADRQARANSEERLRKERERSNRLFIRQVRARQGGGFLSEPRDTLG